MTEHPAPTEHSAPTAPTGPDEDEQPALLLRGGPPTDPLPIQEMVRRTPYRSVQVPRGTREESEVQVALDLAVRVGELMLRCGAGAPQVEGSVAAVAAAAGLTNLEMDITLQAILLQSRSREGVPSTQLRVVRTTRQDDARLVAVHRLVTRFVTGELDIASASKELRQIKARRRVWPDWIVDVASATLAAAVAMMIGASAVAGLFTLGSVLMVTWARSRADRYRLPDFYVNAMAAFVATALAWSGYLLGGLGVLSIRPPDFAFIVAGGIVAMLPGRTLAAAVEDVLSGYPITAAGRLLGTMVALSGLVIGIATALSLTFRITASMRLGLVSPSVLDLNPSLASWAWVVIGGFIIGVTGAITLQSRMLLLAPVGLLCLAAGTLSALLYRIVELGPIMSAGLAAVFIGFFGRFLAQQLRAPAMVVVVPASFALLPGLTIFRGLYALVGPQDAGGLSIQTGLTTLLTALGVLLAIATGTTFGEILASPFERESSLFAKRRHRG